MAMPKPISPQAPFAITAAVGRPPNRGCRISIMEVNTIGNRAIVPLMPGPTQRDKVTTSATSVATSEARSGISYQARHQRHLHVTEALQDRRADRKHNDVGDQRAGERPLHSPAKRGKRDPHRYGSGATRQRAMALGEEHITRPS